MANALYDNYRNLLFGNGTHTLPDLDTDTIKVHLLDAADHTTSLSADVDEADITAAGEVATATLTAKTVGSVGVGVFDADNTTFTSVSGDQAEELVLWQDTGTPATSPLIANFDTATGLPVTPSGGDITIAWNASGIIQI